MRQIRKRLTYANVMSSIAVFLVVGGGAAFAATNLPPNSVGTKQIKKKAVKTNKIGPKAVKVGKLAPEAVKAGKLAQNAVTTNRLSDDAVSTDKIGDLQVTTQKLGNNAVSTEKIGASQVTGEDIANQAVNETKLATDSVGAGQLKGLITRTNSVEVNPGTSGATSVECEAGEQIISVGAHWNAFEANLEISYMRIFGEAAVARGDNDTGTTKTLFVDAYCLAN